MRNLKRALSLLLAAAMLIGMMVVGASAAGSLDDFPDRDEIVNQDAVSLLTILGVIEGTDSGTFNPTGNVTRAEMAKMIATILNQGADVDGLYTGMNTGLTDVAGHWAESYINYCYSLGIIAGRGDGTFDPGANVTGTEAAKMLLVAAGYDPSIEGMEGADWAIRTAALASTLGIFDNLTAPTGDALTRDNAALLVYNALDIEMIQRYQDGYAIAFADSRTILSTKYGVYRIEGVVASNEWARLEGTGSDAALAEGKTRLTDVLLIDSDTVNTIGNNTDDGFEQPDTTFNVSTPVEYLGQTVTMYVRNTTVLANSEVLGVYLKDGANTVLTSVETESSMSDFLKGTGLSVDAGTEYYVNYGVVASERAATTAMGFTSGGRYTSVASSTNAYGIEMTVIDNDQDGTVDYVLYLQEALSQVTVNDDTDAETALNGFNNNGMIDDADIVTELDLAEGDLVLAVEYGGRYYVSAPEVVTGEMESYRNSRATEQVITVDGTEYHPSYIEYRAESADNTYVFNIAECDDGLDGVQFDTTYDFILDSNGNVIAYQPSEQGLYDYALVLDSGYEPGAFASDASGKVKVLLPDGTEGTYELNFSASARNVGEQIAEVQGVTYSTNMGIMQLKGFLGTADSDNSSTAPWDRNYGTYAFTSATRTAPTDYLDGQAKGYVIGYSLNDSNVLTITSIVGSNTNDAKAAVSSYSNDVVDSSLSANYNTGAARIRYGTSSYVVVDRNTVAFYWDVVTAADHAAGRYLTHDVDDEIYGVAVGYDNMSDVDAGVNFVSKEYRADTDLAAVALFESEGVVADRDYVYVLSRNVVHSNTAILNVVYMDGTVGEMTIDRDNYDEIFQGNDAAFGTAYAYSADGDLYELDDSSTLPVVSGYALMLRNGTVALYAKNANGTRGAYIDSYSYDGNIWNVENVDNNDTNAPAGSFSTNVYKEVVMVLDAANKETVRAAFIEDTLTGTVGGGYDPDWVLGDHGSYVTLYSYHSVADIYNAFDEGNNVLIRGDYELPSSLVIPSGRIVYVEGNFDNNGRRVSGSGALWVSGNYAVDFTNNGLDVDTVQVGGTMTLNGAFTTMGASTVYVGTNLDLNGNATTIPSGTNFYVTGDVINSSRTAANLTVDGHIEAKNYTLTGSAVTVNSSTTLVARGNITAATLTIGRNAPDPVDATTGSVQVTGNVNANVVVYGGTLSVTGNVVASTFTVSPTGSNSATVTVTGNVGGANGASCTVNVSGNAGVSVGGTVTGDVTANDSGASVSAGDITGTQNATGGATITEGSGSGSANTVSVTGDYQIGNDTYVISFDTRVSGDQITVTADDVPSEVSSVTITVTPAAGVPYVVNGNAYTTAHEFTVNVGSPLTVTAGSTGNTKTYTININHLSTSAGG